VTTTTLSHHGGPRPLGPATRTALTRLERLERLRPLLHAAAELEIDDGRGWLQLHEAARDATAELVEAGGLPPHLAVMAHDPPAVVARSLVAAWRHATASADLRHHRL